MIRRSDLRAAIRSLARHRGFAATAILSLAVAIAVNTTIYGMLDGLLNPNVGAAHPERLFKIRYFGNRLHTLPPDAVPSALRTGLRSYEGITGYQQRSDAVAVSSMDHETDARPIAVRPNFFALLEVAPSSGRLTVAPSSVAPQVVISEQLERRLYPRGETAVGHKLTVDGQAYSVIGVTKRYLGFAGLDTDVWLLATGPDSLGVPINLLRVRNVVSMAIVAHELSTLSARLALAAGEDPRNNRFYVSAIPRQFRSNGFIYVFIAAVAALLLVVCANLANLQFARGLTRSRELALRASLGASRFDLVRMLLAETLVLAAVGLALGLILTAWGVTALRASIPTTVGGYFVAPQTSWGMLAVAAAAALFSLGIIGVVPALRSSRVDLNALMKGGSPAGRPTSARQRYGVMILAQVGLTFPILAATLFLSRAAVRDSGYDYRVHRAYGFEPESLVVAHLHVPAPRGSNVRPAAVVAQYVSEARAVPGIANAAAVVWQHPIKQAIAVTNPDGSVHQVPTPGWSFATVTPSYFRTIGYPVIRGRGFEEGVHDVAEVVVDERTSWFLWPGADPVGQFIRLGDASSNAPWLRVVGVVGDRLDAVGRVRRNAVDTLRLDNVFKVLAPTDSVQSAAASVPAMLYARAAGNPLEATARVRHALAQAHPRNPPTVEWMADAAGITSNLAGERFIAGIFIIFAGICIGVLVIGVYSIVAQSVAERRREIAVRTALGATAVKILTLVLREGNALVLGGIALGLGLTAWAFGKFGGLMGQADGEAGVALLALLACGLFITAALAAIGPAVAGARIDPAEALRGD